VVYVGENADLREVFRKRKRSQLQTIGLVNRLSTYIANILRNFLQSPKLLRLDDGHRGEELSEDSGRTGGKTLEE